MVPRVQPSDRRPQSRAVGLQARPVFAQPVEMRAVDGRAWPSVRVLFGDCDERRVLGSQTLVGKPECFQVGLREVHPSCYVHPAGCDASFPKQGPRLGCIGAHERAAP